MLCNMELVQEKYKQTEIGLIPSDWKVDFIKNIAQIKTGSRNTQDRLENGLYPFFVRSELYGAQRNKTINSLK
jgi:type I restriction enzyme, S subunit